MPSVDYFIHHQAEWAGLVIAAALLLVCAGTIIVCCARAILDTLADRSMHRRRVRRHARHHRR